MPGKGAGRRLLIGRERRGRREAERQVAAGGDLQFNQGRCLEARWPVETAAPSGPAWLVQAQAQVTVGRARPPEPAGWLSPSELFVWFCGRRRTTEPKAWGGWKRRLCPDVCD